MKSITALNDRNSGTSDKFNQSIRFQYLDELIGFFPMPGYLKYGIIFTNHNSFRPVLTQQSFHFHFFSNNISGNFVQCKFLPNDFVKCIVIGFQYFHLLFNLATKLSHHFFSFVDHDRKTMHTIYLRRGCIQTFNINFSPRENNCDTVQQTDLVFCVNRYGIFLFYHNLVE